MVIGSGYCIAFDGCLAHWMMGYSLADLLGLGLLVWGNLV